MSDLHAAAVTLARALTSDGTLFVLGANLEGFTHLGDADAEDRLRLAARAGDALVIVGDPPDRDRILRRCPAWGVASVWVGETARPEQGLAGVCLLGPDSIAMLAALVSEARALVGDTAALAPAIVDCTDEVCITCSDEGRLGEVIAVAGEWLPALVRTADGEEEVDVTVVGEVGPGDLILIHAGSAIAIVPESSEIRGTR